MVVRRGPLAANAHLAFAFALILNGFTSLSSTCHASSSLAKKQACMACHSVEKTMIGPSFFAISYYYKDKPGALQILMEKTHNGGAGVWGKIPMPPHPQVPETELRAIIQWILALEGRSPINSCQHVTGETERAICADAALVKLDGELNKIYGNTQKSASNSKSLRQAQIAWLRGERDACKADRFCLERSYKARIAALERESRENTGATQWRDQLPFQPHLLYAVDEAVCGQVLNVAKRHFLSRVPVVTMKPADGAQTSIEGWQWLDWQSLEGVEAELPSGSLRKLVLSYKGLKEPRLLVKYSFSHSWRGDNHYAAFFQSPDELRQATKKFTHSKETDGASLLKQGQLYYPDLTVAVPGVPHTISFSTWEDHAVAKYQGRYFFYDEPNYFFRQSDTRRTLLEIESDGTIKPVCIIEVLPGKELTEAFLELPGLRTYFQRLRTMGTGGVGGCGTMNSNVSHDAAAEAALKRLGFRPWAVADDSSYYKWDSRTEQFLREWSEQSDAWSQREYFTWKEEFPSAAKALAHYFSDGFGLEPGQAETQAIASLKQASAAYFLIPDSYAPILGHDLSKLASEDEYMQRDGVAKYFRHLLADGASSTRMETAVRQVTGKPGAKEKARLARMPAPPAAPPDPPAGRSDCGYVIVITDQGKVNPVRNGPPCPSPKVSDPPPDMGPTFVLLPKEVNQLLLDAWELAVPHPHLIKLMLKRGLNVNVTNAFGKTMLMYAAQLNRPDVVKWLLDRGAKVNMETRHVEECGMVIAGGRDALSYAAENAGIEVMRLLLQAGAKVDSVDHENRTPRDYLAGNPYLTPTEKMLPIPELVKIKQSFESDTPSFSCDAQLSPLEKQICQNPALARRDRELDFAFKAWNVSHFGPEAGKEKQASQRNWLKRRNLECGSKHDSEAQVSCLQLLTSARIRFLLGRTSDTTRKTYN